MQQLNLFIFATFNQAKELQVIVSSTYAVYF